MNYEKGQSLVELLVAIGIFVIVVSSLAFLIFNSYTAGALASDITKANFLAEEGLEATRSIRDNSWGDLTAGDHGLTISPGNVWIFSPDATSEDISGQLGQGAIRVITIEDLDADRKRAISKVTWQFMGTKPQEINLITYFTNWQKITPGVDYCTGAPTNCDQFNRENTCISQEGCSWAEASCQGICTPCSGLNKDQCEEQKGCKWEKQECVNNPGCETCSSLDQRKCGQSPDEPQYGCYWSPEFCSGTPRACGTYKTEAECENQDGCQWLTP